VSSGRAVFVLRTLSFVSQRFLSCSSCFLLGFYYMAVLARPELLAAHGFSMALSLWLPESVLSLCCLWNCIEL
jgi:hypothetical protein